MPRLASWLLAAAVASTWPPAEARWAAGAAPGPSIGLSVTPGSISFPDRNPDLPPPYVNAVPMTIQVSPRVTGNGRGTWVLTVAATDHLRSSAGAIDVGHVTWVATPGAPPWTAGGTLALAPGQTVAGGTNNYAGGPADLEFRLANLWSYAAGTYSTTAVFTLTAP